MAQWVAACQVNAGKRVVYVDYESDPNAVVGRLRLLGANPSAMRNFFYVQPEQGPENHRERLAWQQLNSQRFDLVVLDGVTTSLVQSGQDSKDNDGVTLWSVRVPEYLARHTGAAVVMIDHVPKDAATRGRFAIGAQAKLGRISGAAFSLEPKRALGDGMRGVVELRLVKDRPGQLKRHCGPTRWSDRSSEMARFVIDSTDGQPVVTLTPPANDTEKPFRPTAVMEKVSRYLETCTEPKSKHQIEQNTPKGTGSRTSVIRQAVELLVAGGWVTTTVGARNAILHTSAKPYRQQDDPDADAFTGQPDLAG